MSAPLPEHEFSEEHKDNFARLAAMMSFVGVCLVFLGLASGVFALGAGYAGFVPGEIGLGVGAGVCLPSGWWIASAGRSLSGLARTRGRDESYLMDAVCKLRRLFGFLPVVLAAYAAAVAAVAWCTLLLGGKCFAW